MHASTKLLLWLWLPASLFAKDPKLAPAVKPPPPLPVPAAEVVLREIRYEGKLSDTEARFVAELDLESLNKTEASLPLFEGEVAVLSPKLPANLRLLREKNVYRLLVAKPGRYLFKLDLVAKIHRTENVRQLSFAGPSAAIASATAQAVSEGMELQLLSGTPQADGSSDQSRVRGFLGADRNVSLSWQSRTMEAARPALLTCETTVAAQITPTVVKYTTHLRYDILQGKASKLVVNLPAAQAITRIQGEQIRDWQVKPEGGRQTLTIEFVKPAEKAYALTILSEQTIDISAAGIFPPQPQGVERETGSLTVTAEDVLVELDAVSGLRQMNAPAGAWATYQFFGRNTFALAVKLRRIEPVIQTADRVGVRLEETRLLVSHSLTVIVEKAGIYALELAPQPGFAVADVHGEGVDDWKMKEGRLLLSFASRALGARKLEVQLEQALKTVPGEITIQPLRAALAVKETAQIGAAAAAGIQLKTAELAGVREIPASTVAVRAGEALSYAADQADWTVKLSAERLAARLTAEIFNLVTIGDGLVGGSATLRYGILNQGVQEFRVSVPADWKNVEFTGPNIRRKEQQGTNWTVSLQEKAWGGYTLVITYDAQFDPHKATLPVGGAHGLGVERESGTVAITSAANVQLSVKTASETLRRVDESELSATDRALISRPVLLAFQYEGDQYELAVDVARFTELPVLEAVADRTQITTVLTEEGQMLTQASFMVKNNDKQFQRFTLPPGATFWGCYVRNQPVKAERDGEALLVPLPRGSNRDEAFAVDLVYAQKIDSLKSLASRRIALEAPRTDVPNTYNEWELFVPATHRLASFAGNMIVARGTTYELRDAWKAFLRYYQSRQSAAIQWVITAGIMFFLALLLIAAVRRGVRGALVVLGVFALLAVLAGMTLPALNSTGMKSASRAGAAIDVDETVGLSPSESSKESADNSTAALTPTARVASASGKGAVQPGQAAFTVAPAAGGPAATIASSGAVAIAPVVAGLRPIHIDIPRTGERFVFTKVLNVNGESLKIETLAMAATTYQLRQSGAQLAAFLLGALVLGWQFRRPNRQSFLLATGLALVFGSGGSFLLAQRQLHFAFIVAAPTLAGLLLIGVLWSFWRASRRARPQAPGTDPLPVGPGTVPPVAASLLFLLWALSGAQAAKPEAQDTNSVTITSASYQVAVREQAALVEAVITLSASKPGQKVALFGDDVAVQEFSSSPKDAQLLREGRSVSVRLPKKGVATVTLKFLIKHTGDVTRRQLGFAIPPSLTTKLNATLEEPDAAVEAPTAVSFKTTTTDKQTRVEAIIGAGERVELNWTPRVKRTAEIAATIFCQNATLLTFGGGVINAQVTLDYQISQGELRQARVRLPAGQKLMRVEGDSLRTWKISEENGGQTLVVDLARGVTPTWRLILELEQLLTALPASVKLETPHALDVKRETGLVALRASDDLSLAVDAGRDLQKVDGAEFARVTAGKAEGLAGAFRFLKPEFELSARVETMQPQIEAVVRNSLRVGTDQLFVAAQVDYTIRRAGVFTLRLALPADFRIERVTGEKISQWVEKTEGGQRTLEVTLKERTLGACALRVDLIKPVKELAKSLELAGVQPLDTRKLSGFLAVSAEEGVQVKADTFSGLTEIPASQVANEMPVKPAGSVLAYKFIAGEPAAQPVWKLAVATEKIDSWVRAEVVNWLTVRDSLVTGRAVVRYDIANAPTKEFQLRVPKEFKNVEITGADIRRRDQNGEVWRVELQHKTRGAYLLTVTWEQPWNPKGRKLSVAGVEAQSADKSVERETGSLVLIARAPLQVGEESASNDLIRIDPRELPDWAGAAPETPTLAYRYLRPGYKLALTAQRYREAEVLQALVEKAQLTTVVSEDGQMMTHFALSVRNNGRQFLEIALPNRQTNVWSAFVGGQAVRPTVRDGKLLLPLERSGADEAAICVELTYVSTEKFPATRGVLALASPKLDVPLKNVRWELYLPPEFAYTQFAGSMTREPEAAPVYRSFTLDSYSRVENENKLARQVEITANLDNARYNLDNGNVKEANEYFSKARSSQGGGQGDGAAYKKLETDLRRSQARNLIEGQNSVTLNYRNANNQAPAQLQEQAVDQSKMPVYDDAVAERQWSKLQQAQEVAVAQVAPLRVNLPERGLRYAFTQVLQTEIGKEMTINFLAADTKAVNWTARLGMAVAGFALLWAMMAVLPVRKLA